ncbi:O-antigen ligase family protein [Companilactobacillus sp. HBUAS59544]|uniref:O-antigen ligase family protein n=1 Tax=Companilactobacillus sp. HBUAS59544 TaxID=3109363 RepID=UPI002FF372A4
MQSFIKKYSIFLMLYIVFQPVLDAVTGLMTQAHMNVSFGVLIRMAVMAVTVFYLLLFLVLNRDNRHGFMIMGYFVVLGLVSAISMIINYKTKTLFVTSLEISTLAKSLYYPIMLLAYFYAFEELAEDRIINRFFPKVIFIAVNIISIIMMIAHFTNTSFSSYSYYKLGESGWFFAANELSAIVSITFPIMIWYALKKISVWQRLYYWISIILAVYSALLIGTKGSLLALLFSLCMGILASVIQFFKNRSGRKYFAGVIALLVITLGGIIAAYPAMAVSRTAELHTEMIQDKKQKAKTKKGITKDQEKYVKTNKTVSYLFSGRTVYFENAAQNFKKATLPQKVFGMGYATSFKKVRDAKLVEMDYVDIFFQFGFIGTIVFLAPLIYCLIYLIGTFLRKFKDMWSIKWAMLVASVALGFGMALMTGHVIEAPSVSIYFVSILAYALFNARIFLRMNVDPYTIDVER